MCNENFLQIFCGMLWQNISVTEMYWFLGILLKMSLLTGKVEGFKSLKYLPMHVNMFPTCKIEVNDYPKWTENYMQLSADQVRFSSQEYKQQTWQQVSSDQIWNTETKFYSKMVFLFWKGVIVWQRWQSKYIVIQQHETIQTIANLTNIK